MGEGPSAWTRITHGLNVVVWRLPLPRRVKARLSGIVYRNPAMTDRRASETLGALDAAGVETAVLGGWGIDALIGSQHRVHRDLDLVVDVADTLQALEVLRALGYEEWYRDSSRRPLGKVQPIDDGVVVRDHASRVVDIHPVRMPDVAPLLATGTIGGAPLRCLSAEEQVVAHEDFLQRARSRRDRRNLRDNYLRAREACSGQMESGKPA